MNDWYIFSDLEILKDLGNRLRLARLVKRWTQAMLAERSGISRTTIRDLENGKSVTLASFIALMRHLELLDGLDSSIPGPSQSPVLATLQQERKRVRPSKKNLNADPARKTR